jgi:hypothetical protein
MLAPGGRQHEDRRRFVDDVGTERAGQKSREADAGGLDHRDALDLGIRDRIGNRGLIRIEPDPTGQCAYGGRKPDGVLDPLA